LGEHGREITRPLEAIAEAANTSGVLENQLARLRRLESLTEAPLFADALANCGIFRS
jgi:hypothetical protein